MIAWRYSTRKRLRKRSCSRIRSKPAYTPSFQSSLSELPPFEIPWLEIFSLEIPSWETPLLEVPSLEISWLEIPFSEVPSLEMSWHEIPSCEVPSLEIFAFWKHEVVEENFEQAWSPHHYTSNVTISKLANLHAQIQHCSQTLSACTHRHKGTKSTRTWLHTHARYIWPSIRAYTSCTR